MQDIRDSSYAAADSPRKELAGLHHLMEQYIDGDDRAFARLYELLVPRVRARLGKIIRDSALADDLVQLTFMRAHQARERFEVEGGRADRAVEAWYLAIARNVALDHLRHEYRRERRHSVLEARGDVAGMGAPQATPNAEELELEQEAVARTVRRVHAALERLPPSQREVVRLHKLGGLSMAQIAGRLGVRPGALRVRAHRAYKALQTVLLGDVQTAGC
jgi:RNA polymerase sigma-70 factor, ECF subfamily